MSPLALDRLLGAASLAVLTLATLTLLAAAG